jgi:hypothetical protein
VCREGLVGGARAGFVREAVSLAELLTIVKSLDVLLELVVKAT